MYIYFELECSVKPYVLNGKYKITQLQTIKVYMLLKKEDTQRHCLV